MRRSGETMRDRRYADGSGARRPSPQRPIPRSQGFSDSRYGRYSSYQGEREEYPGDAEGWRRIGRRARYDRESELDDPRFSEYDSRERIRYVFYGRQSRTPPRIEKRKFFDRDVSARTDGRMLLGDKGLCRGDLSSATFERDNTLDGPRKYSLANVTADHLTPSDRYGVSSRNPIGQGAERDDNWHSHYTESNRHRLLSSSQYLGSRKSNYEGSERMHSQSYMMAYDGVDMPKHYFGGGDGDNIVSSVALGHMHNDMPEYNRFQDESKKFDGVYNNREDLYYEKKSGRFHFQDTRWGVEEGDRREIRNFDKEDTLLSSQGYLKVDSKSMASSSQPGDYISAPSGSLREGFISYAATGEIYIPSHVNPPGHRFTREPIAIDGYGEKKETMSPRGPSGQRSYLRQPEEIQRDQFYKEIGRSKVEATIPSNAEELFRGKHVQRTDVLDPSIDEPPRSQYTRQDDQWEPCTFTHLGCEPNFEPKLTRKHDLDVLNAGNSGFSYGTEGFHQYGNSSDIIQPGGHALSCDGVYDSHRKRSLFSGLSLMENHSNRRLLQKQDSDAILYGHDAGIQISIDGSGSRKIYNQGNDGDEIGIVNFSEIESSKSHHRRARIEYSDTTDSDPSPAKHASSHSLKSSKSKSIDIRKRLGPVPHKLHVLQRLTKKSKPSIKKRLRRTHPKKNGTLPWVKSKNFDQMVTSADADDMDGTLDNDGDHKRDHVSVAKPEPPEKSEDFEQMVQTAFFKFVKEINETSMKGKKYKYQGKAGTLKCIVCGSNSEEFADTESLAMHAFTSQTVGFRSQHLGLHRALCLVMGWKFPERDGSEWHYEVMSSAEASTLKEDFLVWPPVVIVHNCSLHSKNPDERIIITTEKLHTKLKEIGFNHILKVCNGRPANQSVMLVKFNATLSGLLEALRCHQSFVESKHGKAGMAQLNPSTGGWTEENVLYGHLGLLVDLDKLDFDTKKRCILRSKKDILSRAGE